MDKSTENSSQRVMILIHGTWGRNSPWAKTDKRSHLYNHLRDGEAKTDIIARFPWSGRNWPAARYRAAARLKDEICSHLENGASEVVLIAHSHSGNIGIYAIARLEQRLADRVRMIAMATPFLHRGHRFNPARIWKRTLGVEENVILFGFILLSALLPRLLAEAYIQIQTDRALLALSSAKRAQSDADVEPLATEVLRWVYMEPSIWISIIPFLVVGGVILLSQRFAKRSVEKVGSEPKLRPMHGQVLSITYASDEAFSFLAIWIHSLTMIQQVLFLVVSMGFRGTRKFGLLSVPFKIGWLAMFLGGIGALAMFPILMALSAIEIDLPDVTSKLAFGIDKLTDGGMRAILLIALCAALIITVSFLLFATAGLARMGILLIAGVLTPIHSISDLTKALFGTFTISQSPQGPSNTIVLDPSSAFAHTKIHSDIRVFKEIDSFLSDNYR